MTGFWRGKKVLISGAAGFIASHLARRLLEMDARIHAIVHPEDDRWRLADVEKALRVHPLDIRDVGAVTRVVRQAEPEIIFHLAAYVNLSRSAGLLAPMMAVNFQGTVNLLTALEGIAFRRFVNTGTSEEYGGNPLPFHEEQREQPLSPYSLSKLAAAQYCQMLYRTRGAPTVTLRPFTVYGPRQTGKMLIPSLITHSLEGRELAMTAGEQTRDFVYVEDVAEGFLLAAEEEGVEGEVINLGGCGERRIKEATKIITRLCGGPPVYKLGALPYRAGEAMRLYCTGEKAAALLGWRASTRLETGLEKTVAWYKERLGKNG